MKHYSQLTLEQRYIIYSMLKIGLTQSKIAEVIGIHKSTVSRELKRNRGGRGYRPKQANAFAKERQQAKVRPRIDGSTWAYVEQLLREEWSPEQISGWMKMNLVNNCNIATGSINIAYIPVSGASFIIENAKIKNAIN